MNHGEETHSGFERTQKTIHVFQREQLRACALSLLINLLLDVVWDSGRGRPALLDHEALQPAPLKALMFYHPITYPAKLETP